MKVVQEESSIPLRKQSKGTIMKKIWYLFLRCLYWWWDWMVGWVVLFMGYSYQRSYNECESSDSGSTLTYPVQNTLLQVLYGHDYKNQYEFFEQNSSTLDEDIPDGRPGLCLKVSLIRANLAKRVLCDGISFRRWCTVCGRQYWLERASAFKGKGIFTSFFQKKISLATCQYRKYTQEEVDYAIENVGPIGKRGCEDGWSLLKVLPN